MLVFVVSISYNPSVGEFVWPGVWLMAGGRMVGGVAGRADGWASKPQSSGVRLWLV